MAPNPFLNQLSALQQIDYDLLALVQAVIANQQAQASLTTSGVMRTTVDFIDVILSSRAARRDPIATLTHTQPAMAGASAVVIAANLIRRYLRISNPAVTTVFLHFGAAPAVVTDLALLQGAVWESKEPQIYTGELRGITGGGATVLDVVEG
jgi:hypothetical protein